MTAIIVPPGAKVIPDKDSFTILYFSSTIVGVQTAFIYNGRTKSSYARYLLEKTFPSGNDEDKEGQKPSKKENLAVSVGFFEYHLNAVKRYITRRSGGYFAPLFRITVREKLTDELTFDDLRYALKMNMINEASKLPTSEYCRPFKAYFKEYESKFENKSPTAKAWIEFLLVRMGENKRPILDEVNYRQKRKRSRKIRQMLTTREVFWVNLKEALLIILILTFIIVTILGLLGMDTSKINNPFF